MTKNLRLWLFGALFLVVYLPFVMNYGLRLIQEDSADFPSYYYGARLAFLEKVSPYEPASLKIVAQEYTENNGDLYPYLYLPPSLVFFLPLTWIDFETARLLMLLLNHLLTLAFLYLFLFKLLKAKPGSLLAAGFVVYLFLFPALALTIDVGQINLVILCLICLAWYFQKEKKGPWWVALPLSLAIILKLYPILFLVPLFLKKQYKTILYALLLLVLISGLASAMLPNQIWQSWFANVGARGYGQDIPGVSLDRPANQSINGFLIRLFFGKNVRFPPLLVVPGWVSKLAPYLLNGTILLVSLLASWWVNRQKANPGQALDLEYALWLLVSYLIAPISWVHHLVFLLPAMAVLIYNLWLDKTGPNLVLLLVAGAAAIFLATAYPANSPDFRVGLKTLLISAQLFAVALLWLITLISFLRLSKASPPRLETFPLKPN